MSVERLMDLNKTTDILNSTEKSVLLVVDDSKSIDAALKPLEAVSECPSVKEKGIKCFLICLTDMPAVLDILTDFKASPTYYFMKFGEEVILHQGLLSSKELEAEVLKVFS